MNESQPSSDRDHIAAGAEKYRQRQAEEFLEDFGHRLDELMGRVVAELESGRLDAGRRHALLERIAYAVGLLVDLADEVEPSSGSDRLPRLEGSTKQVALAEQLRGALIQEVERAGDLDLLDHIRAVSDATWFIAAQGHPLETLRDSLGL
jgi:hypothetical protein